MRGNMLEQLLTVILAVGAVLGVLWLSKTQSSVRKPEDNDAVVRAETKLEQVRKESNEAISNYIKLKREHDELIARLLRNRTPPVEYKPDNGGDSSTN